MTRIAVIGGGRIGEALVAGLLESGRASKDLVVVEPVPARADVLAQRFGSRVTDSVSDAVVGADLIVVAVKPHDVDGVLTELVKAELGDDRDQVLVSLAAGIPTGRFEAKLPAGFPVVRVMPNTPMLVGQGMSAIAPGRYARPEQLRMVTEMLESVGKVVTVAEAQMDAVTAVSGSGPAYFFLIVEAMIDAGVGLGLTRDVASQLVVQTMLGAAALLDESGQSAAELRAAVTSPAGTTAAAVRELERGAVRAVFHEALHAAKDRSAEMGATSD
ncbi:pyrroline-5-carboxylate reductase [Nocardia otitidiscaviarum]|uniref:Pyrroline-5-carboxylate reductase n=1 Tax=Nocardia otitidiscaviarum TaxID=1823 RepID=A0A516NVZ2_9NOCA|nr:pyrroline-5-carboxylate reductase [Nocardia otitidiscaviarum]MCP9622586.1 pyrroline-5-carboxylate reductase [Nocardia otitidiscaviarum]QDP83079.1 pyrroline-5-carboxylate reductase [Nocardia otitidiscaviarum]